jgi:TetR/AcrR family transcriptional repressor of nem operon
MARTIEFDRAVVLEAAMETFWTNGYEATSLQDLLNAMGLSKSSFYQAFGSKEELFITCLVHYQKALVAEFRTGLGQASSPLTFIEDYVLSIADGHNTTAAKGCLLMNTASEFAQRNPEIGRVTAQGIESLEQQLTETVRQAQAAGEVAGGADPADLGAFLTTAISGLKTLAKGGTPEKRLRAAARTALAALPVD